MAMPVEKRVDVAAPDVEPFAPRHRGDLLRGLPRTHGERVADDSQKGLRETLVSRLSE
jgi:hypothetical protein